MDHKTSIANGRSLALLAATLLVAYICNGQDRTGATSADATEAPVITPVQLQSMMTAGKVYVFDCNEPDYFVDAHVPGAILTVFNKVTPAILPQDQQATLVFYCYSPECPAGTIAARTALNLGYPHTYCMLAGITGWEDANLKTEP